LSWLRVTLAVIFTAGVVYFFYRDFDAIYAAIKTISSSQFLLVSASLLVFVLLQGLALRQVLKFWDIRLGAVEWIGLTFITFMANFLVPFLGFGFRAAYLKRFHGFSIADFGKSLIILFAFELAVFAGIGLAAALFGGFPGYLQWFFCLGLASMVGGLIVSFVIKASMLGPLRTLGHGILEPWQQFWKRTDLARSLLVITAAQYAAFVLAHHVAFFGLNMIIPVPTSFVAASLVDFSFLLRLTPANVGGYEGALMLAGVPIGLSFVQAAAVASVLRGALIVVLAPAAPIFLLIFLRRSGVALPPR
jgi:uncharacterized membrane protein YbhN (UPF0104 family)